MLYWGLFTFSAAFIAAIALCFSACYEDGIAAVAHTQRGLIFCHHEAKESGWLNNSYDYCTQKKAIEELANAVNILLVSSEEIEQDALKVEEIHLASKGIRYLPSINASSPKSKRRWAVNHIRHILTDYDIKVSDLNNLEGNPQLNYFYFKDLILTRIKKVYPQYSDECDKQIKNLREIYHRKFSA